MNRNLVYLGLIAPFLFLLAGCAATANQYYAGDQSYIDDVEYLSSYGGWVDHPPYGMVWLPDVVPDWEPFYYGHWIWTDDGWAWTSYEPFGWLVYHYGYWDYEPGFGWYWVPGDTWWPARVQWITFGTYAAWAPLPPPSIVWPDPWDPYDVNIWVVVDINNFTDENIGRHRVVRSIYRERAHDRGVVRKPPGVGEVEKATRRTVTKVKIREEETAIQPRVVSERPPRMPRREEQTPARGVSPEAEKRKVDSKQPATVRREKPTLKRMVLPRAEKRKVEKHESQVKREVLTSRKKAQEQQKRTQSGSAKTKRK